MEALFILAFVLSSFNNGVDISVGVSMHDENDYNQPDPLGVLRIDTNPGGCFHLTAQHITSVPSPWDNDTGLNTTGIDCRIHIEGFK